jgi:hypothetical protein
MSVKITGNRHFDQGQLADQVVVQRVQFLSHGKFSNDLVSRSVSNLTAYYRNAGYADVQVQPQVVEHGQNVEVTFGITESERTNVETLNVEGNKTQTLAKLAPKGLNLKAGQPYSQARLDKDRSEIIANYLQLGYPNATFRWSVKPLPGASHRVAVTYFIDEGMQAHISDVVFLGDDRTKLGFLQKNTSVKAEEPLDEAQLLGSESSLYNLGIFDWVNVAPRRPITGQQTEEVQVKVHEAKRNSLTYGLGLLYTPVAGSLSSGIVALPGLPTLALPPSFKVIEKSVFSPLGSIEYSRLNLLGRAETASISTALSLLDQRGSLSYADPQFDGFKWASLLSVSAERSAQNPLFTARLGTASFQLEKVLDAAKTKRLQFRYTFQRTTLTNLLIQDFVPPEDENVSSSALATSFIRDTRDKPLDAHVSMHRSQSSVIGQGSVTLTEARVWGQPVQNLSVQFQGAGDTIHSTLQLSAPAGSGSGKLTYDFKNQGYDVQFNLSNIQLQRLEAINYKNMHVSGVATAFLQGRGTVKDPQLTATIEAPKLVIGQRTLDGLKLHAELARQQARFDLDSAATGASIQARGVVSLNDNYSTQADIDVRNIQLGALLAAFLPKIPADVRGQAELHGTLHGPLKLRDQLQAEVDIPTLSLNYRSLQIGNASPSGQARAAVAG